ncbi:hypothetical protein IMZ48_02890 [Candidatus Bathyarchaeota archaeon]|nr:hypothetical protein [Candidatus Bathyarchaeota archaeon]
MTVTFRPPGGPFGEVWISSAQRQRLVPRPGARNVNAHSSGGDLSLYFFSGVAVPKLLFSFFSLRPPLFLLLPLLPDSTAHTRHVFSFTCHSACSPGGDRGDFEEPRGLEGVFGVEVNPHAQLVRPVSAIVDLQR